MEYDRQKRRLRRRLAVVVAAAALSACNGALPADEIERRATTGLVATPRRAATAPAEPITSVLSNETIEKALLDQWFDSVGPTRKKESFGRLVSRVGRLQLGTPYGDPPQDRDPERLTVELETFQCVSFVESTLAVARCTWSEQPNGECFLRELQALRYRDGIMDGYGSRLHYFTDWIDDNTRRGHLRNLSIDLGGKAETFDFTFMTAHPLRYPALADPHAFAEVNATEERLSRLPHLVLGHAAVSANAQRLRSGDLVAIVSDKYPGLRVRHAGFIDRTAQGLPRLLHASSSHKRVMITAAGIADYMTTRPDRRGIVALRPQPPE
ncbi:MAG: N-acetylmuramoyl-L-alanine amidase-like domain-containing protein [Myxococcota bacterium]